MATTHITDKGPKRCVAKSEESCRAKYDGEKAPHFSTEEDAHKAYQTIEATKHKLLSSMKKEAPAKEKPSKGKAPAARGKSGAPAKAKAPRSYPQGFTAQEVDEARGTWDTIEVLQRSHEEVQEKLTALARMKARSTKDVDLEALEESSRRWEEEDAKLPKQEGITRLNPYTHRLDKASAETFPGGEELPRSSSFAEARQRYEKRQTILEKHQALATEEAARLVKERDALRERVKATTGYEENPVYGVPSGKTTKETSYRVGDYSSAPTKDVPVLVDAKRGVEGAVETPCKYCGTADPKHVKFVQASYSDETRCSRCGGVDGYGIGD